MALIRKLKLYHTEHDQQQYNEHSGWSSSTTLTPTTTPLTSVAMSSVMDPKCLEQSSFYTNGHYLMVIIPPSILSDHHSHHSGHHIQHPHYSNKTFLCVSFSLTSGTVVGTHLIEAHLGSAFTYDYVNNVIWNYSATRAEVIRYIYIS